MKTTISKSELKENICPLCGHNKLRYSSYEILKSIQEVLVDWTCPKCHAYGSIDFKLTFSSYLSIYNEKEKQIEIL